MRLHLLLLLPALILFGCRANPSTNTDIAISIEMANASPAVGEQTNILVTLADSAGNPISDADVNLRGDMAHAGMSPVLGEATSGTSGVYEVPFEFSMGGDWVITVDVTLADGSTASKSFNINGIGSEPSPEASQDMSNMGNMGNMTSAPSMGVSAAYFSISNSGTEDVRLMTVTAEGIGQATIYQTIVENNIARMEEVEGGFLIPAGGTAELSPSGYHLMLMDIAQPLVEGQSLALSLNFDNNVSLTVEASITMIAPDEGGSAESETIHVSGAWLRPTTSGQ